MGGGDKIKVVKTVYTGENGEAKQVGFDFATTEQVNEKANTSLDNITALINEDWFTSIENVDMRTCSDVSGMYADKTASSFYVQGFSNHTWYACGIKGD